MRKCLRCNSEMTENCDLKIYGGAYGIEIAVGEGLLAKRIGKPKVAICPECGEVSLYTENTAELKNTKK